MPCGVCAKQVRKVRVIAGKISPHCSQSAVNTAVVMNWKDIFCLPISRLAEFCKIFWQQFPPPSTGSMTESAMPRHFVQFESTRWFDWNPRLVLLCNYTWLLCIYRHLAAGGMLFSGCPRMCDHIVKVVNAISYKPVVGISPNLQLQFTMAQRWTD